MLAFIANANVIYNQSGLKTPAELDLSIKSSSIDFLCLQAHKLENGKALYRVRWHGYPPEADTWEPPDAFDDPTTISNYLSRSSILEEGNVNIHNGC